MKQIPMFDGRDQHGRIVNWEVARLAAECPRGEFEVLGNVYITMETLPHRKTINIRQHGHLINEPKSSMICALDTMECIWNTGGLGHA